MSNEMTPGLTHDEIEQGLRNLGHDPSCGACMEVFYTGVTLAPHTCNERTIADVVVDSVIFSSRGHRVLSAIVADWIEYEAALTESAGYDPTSTVAASIAQFCDEAGLVGDERLEFLEVLGLVEASKP